jgi:hypothetical protein
MRRLGVVLFIVVIVWGGLACSPAVDASASLVPGFLIGTWRTETESHRDTFLRLTPTTIAFGTAEGTVEWHIVSSVTRTQDATGTLYTINYMEPSGNDFHIEFYFDDQTLRLKNQPQMQWKWSRY